MGRASRAAGNGRRLSRDDAREFLEELQRLCVRELRDTGHFSISKIAKLVVGTRCQRRGRDPVTGEAITISPRRVVRVRFSSPVRDAIDVPLPLGGRAPDGPVRRYDTVCVVEASRIGGRPRVTSCTVGTCVGIILVVLAFLPKLVAVIVAFPGPVPAAYFIVIVSAFFVLALVSSVAAANSS